LPTVNADFKVALIISGLVARFFIAVLSTMCWVISVRIHGLIIRGVIIGAIPVLVVGIKTVRGVFIAPDHGALFHLSVTVANLHGALVTRVVTIAQLFVATAFIVASSGVLLSVVISTVECLVWVLISGLNTNIHVIVTVVTKFVRGGAVFTFYVDPAHNTITGLLSGPRAVIPLVVPLRSPFSAVKRVIDIGFAVKVQCTVGNFAPTIVGDDVVALFFGRVGTDIVGGVVIADPVRSVKFHAVNKGSVSKGHCAFNSLLCALIPCYREVTLFKSGTTARFSESVVLVGAGVVPLVKDKLFFHDAVIDA